MIDKERFDAWRSDSTTKEVFRFLKDYQTEMAMRWASGEQMPEDAQYVAKSYGELVDLEHEDIARFYAKEETSEQPDGKD